MIKSRLTRDQAAKLLLDRDAASALEQAHNALTIADTEPDELYEYEYCGKTVGIESKYACPGSITVPAYTVFIAIGRPA